MNTRLATALLASSSLFMSNSRGLQSLENFSSSRAFAVLKQGPEPSLREHLVPALTEMNADDYIAGDPTQEKRKSSLPCAKPWNQRWRNPAPSSNQMTSGVKLSRRRSIG